MSGDVGPYRRVGEAHVGLFAEAVHVETGAPALIPYPLHPFAREVECDELVSLLVKRPVAGVARYLQARPIVIERPKGMLLEAPIPPIESAELAIQLLERMGRIHEIGWAELPVGPEAMWVDDSRGSPGGRLSLTLTMPDDIRDYPYTDLEGVRRDLFCAVAQLVRWTEPGMNVKRMGRPERAAMLEIALGGRRETSEGRELVAFFQADAASPSISSPREAPTARSVATLVARAFGLRDMDPNMDRRLEAIADIAHVRRVFDWDQVIADAERNLVRLQAELVKRPGLRSQVAWTTLALANAHQQRARRRWAVDERASALADMELAVKLDPDHEPYLRDLAIMKR